MDIVLANSIGWPVVLIMCAVVTNGYNQDADFSQPIYDSPSPVLDTTPEEVIAKNGSKAELPCHVLNGDNIGVMWHFGGFDVSLSSGTDILVDDPRFTIDKTLRGDFKLVIENVQVKDTGLYHCMTPTLPPQVKSVTLTVLASPTINTSALSPVYSVEEGKSLNVTCVATGYPYPKVKWYKDTTDPTNSKNKKELFSSSQVLYIKSIKYGDNIYGCTAENEYGSAMYEIFVDILYAPRLKVPLTSVSAKKMSDIKLECIVDSNPSATTFWYKDGRQLHTNWKYFVETLENFQSELKKTFRLTIRQLAEEDVGFYVCKCRNRIGRAEERVEVSIQRKSSTSTSSSTRKTTSTTVITTSSTAATTTSTSRSTQDTFTDQMTTPLSIEEPRTGGSKNNQGTIACINCSVVLIVSVVTLLSILDS